MSTDTLETLLLDLQALNCLHAAVCLCESPWLPLQLLQDKDLDKH